MVQSAQHLLQRAGKLIKSGQFDLAEQEYLALLARFPANARARAGLAKLRTSSDQTPVLASTSALQQVVALLQNGKTGQADKAVKKLLAHFPNQPEVNTLSGLTCAACGRHKEAVHHYQKALEHQPGNADTWYNLGNAQRALGDNASALEAYAKTIAYQPDYPAAYTNIGATLSDMGETAAAITAFEQWVLLAPQDGKSHRALGKEHYNAKNYSTAISCYRQAERLTPPTADLFLDLGNALFSDGQPKAAIVALEKALHRRPEFTAALNSLASVYRSQGKLLKAQDLFEKALLIDPDNYVSHYNLSTLKHYRAGDAQMAVMVRALAAKDLPPRSKMYLDFALAKAHLDLGEWDASFTRLSQANSAQRNSIAYDIAAENKSFHAVQYAFQSPVTPLVPGQTCPPLPGAAPLFVLGMPRSGTTLCEQILASHSHVYGAGELPFLDRAINQSAWNGGPPSESQLLDIRTQYLTALKAVYLPRTKEDGQLPRFVTDKMPANFRLIGFIQAALPEARIIHVKRDAIATCWSILSRFFTERGTSNGYTCDQVELATYYRMYLAQMKFWAKNAAQPYYDLGYEQLTENQESETRRLLGFVGLDWQAQCLDFQNTNRDIRTASAAQVRTKMYQGSSDKWRPFAPYLSDMIDILDGH